MNKNEKILLHVCCAPCASACIERLLDSGRSPTLYFSNSNIDSETEFEKRLSYVEKLAELFDVPIQTDAYCHEAWLEHISGLENEPEKGFRCFKCFDWSMARTAAKASELGISAFTTTLTISPHKVSRVIFETGAAYTGFECWDFKKQDGFKRSLELSDKFELYRQSYCGCEFSLR